MKNILLIIPLFCTGIPELKAQTSGSASITTNNTVTIPCSQTCTTLTATVFGGAQTSSYLVSQIAYNPPLPLYTGAAVPMPQGNEDDFWSPVINLPFTFCYFGNTYNKIVVQSNGAISFDTVNANLTPASWDIPGPAPLDGNPSDMTNCIMAPWQDLDNTLQGQIYYTTGGTAPNRYFAVSWYNCAMYGDLESTADDYCSHDDHQSQQIILYETSNVIDINILNKRIICNDLDTFYWNHGWAIEGIQNKDASVFYGVPGRNATQWAASNDAWRFTPSGPPDYSLAWFQGTTQIGTGDSVQVCPSGSSSYTVQVAYTLCDSSVVSITDTIILTRELILDSPVISQPNCIYTGSIAANAAGGTGPVTYNWSNGETGARDTGLIAATYNVTATDSLGCSASASYVLYQSLSFASNNAVIITPGCGIGQAGRITLSPLGNYNYQWSNGETTATDTGLTAGFYSVTVTDTSLCSVTAGFTLSQGVGVQLGNPVMQGPSCNGNSAESITANVILADGPVTYLWSNGEQGARDSALTAAAYGLTVTDTIGCSNTAVYQFRAITFYGGNWKPACNGINDGSIDLQVSGGTGNYTFTWSPNVGNGPDITNLAGGLYKVTVADAAGCLATDSFNVDSGWTPIIAIYGDSNFCAGSPTTFYSVITHLPFNIEYEWLVNGINSYVSTDTFPVTGGIQNGALITCVLTSQSVCALLGSDTSNSISINRVQPPAQPICIVTTDTTGTENIVVWDKTNKHATDSFYIYRADTPDTTFAQIAAVSRDSLSEYYDTSSQPGLMSYRYKMNLLDTCGDYSLLSDYHQTIFLQYTGNGNFQWTPYAIENQALQAGTYGFYRDSTGNGNWQLLDTIPENQTTATDPNYAQYPNARYVVRFMLANACNPTRSVTAISSNILSHITTAITRIAPGAITVVPNPAHDRFEIVNTNEQDNLKSLVLYDQLGKRFSVPYFSTGAARLSVDIRQLAGGLYYVILNYENSNAAMKVVKE